MLFVDRPRKRVISLPVLPTAAVIVLASPLVAVPAVRHDVWSYVLPVLFLFIAITSFGVVTRVGNRLLVRWLLGRQWVPAQSAFLLVTTRGTPRGGATIEINLMRGSSPELQATVQSLASYSALGLDRPMRAAERIAEALALPPPRLPPWLQPGGVAAPAPEPAARRWRDLLRSRWTLGTLFAVALGISIFWTSFLSRSQAELYLRCRTPRQVKLPLGELLLTRSTGFGLGPGEVTVELWNPDRACWTQRTLTVKRATRTILDLDELAALGRCDRRAPPPISPDPRDPHPRRR